MSGIYWWYRVHISVKNSFSTTQFRKPMLKSDISKYTSCSVFFFFFWDDELGFLKEGVQTFLKVRITPLDSPTFFLSSLLKSMGKLTSHHCWTILKRESTFWAPLTSRTTSGRWRWAPQRPSWSSKRDFMNSEVHEYPPHVVLTGVFSQPNFCSFPHACRELSIALFFTTEPGRDKKSFRRKPRIFFFFRSVRPFPFGWMICFRSHFRLFFLRETRDFFIQHQRQRHPFR
jgi:hypothetical protein